MKKKLIEFKSQFSNNLWYHFFKEELAIETWIDFENRIEFVLKKIYKAFLALEENVFSKGSRKSENKKFFLAYINKDMEILYILRKFNILEKEDSVSFNIREQFLNKRLTHYTSINFKEICKYLYLNLLDFKKVFEYYFNLFVLPLLEFIKKDETLFLFKKIDKHYTFNYTPTFEKIYENQITTHLHGEIGNIDNQIVLGIDYLNTPSLQKNYFIKFLKNFQKINHSKEFSFIERTEYHSTSDELRFFFMGHSLDLSDKIYIDEIFDYITSSIGDSKIIIIYHNNSSKSSLIDNLLQIRKYENLKKLLEKGKLEFLDIKSDKLVDLLNEDFSSDFSPLVF